MGLRLLYDVDHHLQSLHRIFSVGGLTGKHYHIGAVVDCVGHVCHLRTGWTGIPDHGIQHLGGCDDHLACLTALFDHHFLEMGQLLRRDLHAQVAPGHHDAVALFNDIIQIFQPFLIFDLGDDAHGGAALGQDLPDLPDGVRRADKGGSNIIKAHLHPKTDIVLVFFCQGRKLDLYAWHVDALSLAQLAAIYHQTDDPGTLDLPHMQLDQAVVNEDPVSRRHISVQAVVIDMDHGLIPHDLFCGKGKFLAFL